MVTLKFIDCGNQKDSIELSIDNEDKKHLWIESKYINNFNRVEKNTLIKLDKSTAIKFSKELRKQIALLD